MLTITYEVDLEDFEAFGEGRKTLDHIIDEGGVERLQAILEEMYPNGMTDGALNDLLWHESDWCFEMAGVSNPYESTEEEEEDEGWTDEKQDAFDDFCNQYPDCEGCPYQKFDTMTECQLHWEDEFYLT